MKPEIEPRTAMCPDCKGNGRVMALVDYADRRKSGSAFVECMFCRGVGWITDRQMNWRASGAGFRQERVAAGISLHRAAKSYGITAAQLSAMESGRADPSALAGMRTPK